MAGIKTIATYTPVEIHGPGHEKRVISIPVTIPKGLNLVAGTLMGIEPGTLNMAKNYDKDGAAASATSPAAGINNVGNGVCGAVTVSDTKTNTEDWSLTCIAEAANSGTFEVKGSVSGVVGNATVGTLFNYNNVVSFTIADGSTDFKKGDLFTFSTVGAAATVAVGVLPGDVNSILESQFANIEVTGVFRKSVLTGLDDDAYANMYARDVGEYLII